MSAFRDLLEQASAKGVRFLAFTVDLKDFFADEQNEAWRATAEDNHFVNVVPDGVGRTGEEALRHLVERL